MTDESSSLDPMDDEILESGTSADQNAPDQKVRGAKKDAFAKAGKILKESPLVDRDIHLHTDQAVEAELTLAKNEAAENHDRYLRALAELENFKKRTLKERSDLIKYQGERIFTDLLDIIDDLDRALQFKESDPQSLVSGFEMIYGRFKEFLGKWEIRGDSQIGKDFDPTIHNALAKVPSAEQPAGKVVNELKKPFFYKDKLLRPGEVIVSEGASKDVPES